MKIYHYHKVTGESLGEADARIDPLETEKQGKNIYSIPAQASTDQPPRSGDNEATRRLPDDSDWEIVPDFRGVKYWLEDGTEVEIAELGETVPTSALSEQPDPPPLTEEQLNEQKVADEIRKLAIDNLIARGDLPEGYA